ncbi:MAG: phosphoribosylaminoimidazolesuccinocarboxamide synthase [Omnitrophica bacterium RIFCSPHIGHO2_02_FULL_51_18]|nr:MAG: phosphoribosylaminoimidazolesuccinocarboxamide synthase [Omnitrophica bacterium RIFCSPHIGHO2_02_FULL_51_18]
MDPKIFQEETVWETKLSLPLVNRGKVRDIYAVGDNRLLIVTTDRLSAFDVVLPTPIPCKGKVLNQISLFWFEKFNRLVPNHVITDNLNHTGLGDDFIKEFGNVLSGRFILVHRAKPLPVECVVRGFLAGSGWKDYLKTGKVCGHALRPGLRQCEELLEPVFTPSTKATVGHDENISFNKAVKLIGRDLAQEVKRLSTQLYKEGVEYAKTRGIIIADTKFEFGLLDDKLILIDEALTPDSSRFWPQETYKPGQDQPSLDKQIVRDFLEKSGWDKTPPGPALPQKIAEKTSTAYVGVYERLTGRDLL